MAITTPEKLIKDKGECPFCGSRALYDQYVTLDGFKVASRICDGCKAIFTLEGIEDFFATDGDDFRRLDAAWKRRPAESRAACE